MKSRITSVIISIIAVLLVSVPGVHSVGATVDRGVGVVSSTPLPNGSQAAPGSPLAPAGSGFTYQGRLIVGGSPASGNFDFTFTLYDASPAAIRLVRRLRYLLKL